MVSPDAGGVTRAKMFRDGLSGIGVDVTMAMIIKQRKEAGVIGQMDLVGTVKDCDCVIVDDMIDTAGTLCTAANELRDMGAKGVYAFATHGLFNGVRPSALILHGGSDSSASTIHTAVPRLLSACACACSRRSRGSRPRRWRR